MNRAQSNNWTEFVQLETGIKEQVHEWLPTPDDAWVEAYEQRVDTESLIDALKGEVDF